MIKTNYLSLQDSGMKTLIALDDQEELIDKFEGAMDGINSDMALAEKALKVRFYIGNKLLDYI